MATGTGDFELTMDELRAVARFAVESAQEVLPIFERADGEDLRPRAAIEAAWAFVNGAARSNVQRLTSLDAHRAAKRVVGEPAHFAARSAGDAAAAAYLHPIAKATQVGHILRAAATAARATELNSGDNPDIGDAVIEQARRRATAVLITVLHRYPPAPTGNGRVALLMKSLDTSLRTPRSGIVLR